MLWVASAYRLSCQQASMATAAGAFQKLAGAVSGVIRGDQQASHLPRADKSDKESQERDSVRTAAPLPEERKNNHYMQAQWTDGRQTYDVKNQGRGVEESVGTKAKGSAEADATSA